MKARIVEVSEFELVEKRNLIGRILPNIESYSYYQCGIQAKYYPKQTNPITVMIFFAIVPLTNFPL